MKILFDWVKEYCTKDKCDIYYRRTSAGVVVAKLQLQKDDVFGDSYCVRLYVYPDDNKQWYNQSIPTNYQFALTIAKAQRWADKNLKHLGYKFVNSKYKVML